MIRTHTINLNFNPRTHNFVPAVNTPDEPSGTVERARPAKGMREGGVGREVAFYGCTLD